MKTGLMNPAFKYTRAAETNISKLFARVRRELKEAETAKQTKPVNVRAIRKAAP